MEALSSQARLKTLLKDREPFVVLAAAHSLFLLGDRGEVFEFDYAVLNGERKSADGFVASQISELRDPRVDAARTKACPDRKWSVRVAAVFANRQEGRSLSAERDYPGDGRQERDRTI